MLIERSRLLNDSASTPGAIVYWMHRDQRVEHNWAFIFAQDLAEKTRQPLVVVFTFLVDGEITWRQCSFMIHGLKQVEKHLAQLNIPLIVLLGDPLTTIPQFVRQHNIGALVTDFSPLNMHKGWRANIACDINIPMYEVDAHNIVPCWVAASRQEFSARTLRLKINRVIADYLDAFPDVRVSQYSWKHAYSKIDWDEVLAGLPINYEVSEVSWCVPGSTVGREVARAFLLHSLESYAVLRNNPTLAAQSNLSPYLHFGQISAQQLVLDVMALTSVSEELRAAFLEEVIIRRELADNFCYYNESYDQCNGFPFWARKTLEDHQHDKRDFLYTCAQFERAETHDPLWNSAQIEMLRTGKMHGFMRMYWAKKILEWSPSPAEAMKIAIYLNDKYELDGCDPNGYAGIAWSIGGVHDRPWFDRPVFGKIRYMNANGCARKFDVQKYIEKNR